MKNILAFLSILLCCNGNPNRHLIRHEILIHKLSRSNHVLDPFYEKIIQRRFRRDVDVFPSDDEDMASSDYSGDFETTVDATTISFSTDSQPTLSTSTDWAWYRTTINFLDSVQYSADLRDYHTPAFAVLAHDIMIAVESYLNSILGGYHEAVPLTFSDGDDVMVQIDVGTCMSYSAIEIANAMQSLVKKGTIGRFKVSLDGFNIRLIGTDPRRPECSSGPNPPISTVSTPGGKFSTPANTQSVISTTTSTGSNPGIPTCRFDQATCKNFQCIDRSYVCDGTPDCLDGSDEPESCSTTTQCEPTEFFCNGTGLCAQKIWRCDGDNDCGNGFDELDCPSAPVESRCLATHFECRDRVCVPASYRCDGELDCDDGSDEDECTAPVIIRLPQRQVTALEGTTVTLQCKAIGSPNPIISWRVNWGNVPPPPRVTMSSQNGIGVLIIRKVKSSDQGAYTCEAINPNGSILGTPDTILVVDKNPILPSLTTTAYPTAEPEPCPIGSFNTAEPDLPLICKPCFCFGVTDLCKSSRLKYGKVAIEFTEPDNDKGVSLEPIDVIDGSPDETQPITDNQIRVNPPVKELQLIDLSKRFLAAAHYWSLPAQFLGGKINSYGGTLTFSFSYNNSYHLQSTPTSDPDVILEGNDETLFYKSTGPHPGPVMKHTTTAILDENQGWKKINGRQVTRADFMNVLSNLDRVLLRTIYDKSMLSTGIGDIKLQVAGLSNSNSLPTAESNPQKVYAGSVEECLCPEGYEGLSCQECSPGYERVPSLGRCIAEEQGDSPTAHCEAGYTGPGCQECADGYVRHNDQCRLDFGQVCNPIGTSEIDLNGECLCKDATQGANCEECRPGYFYLTEESQDGCLSCLCMGVTKSCRSSSLKFAKMYSEAEIELVDIDSRKNFSNFSLRETDFVSNERMITLARLDSLPKGMYYWKMPAKFIGNKLSSYGGSFRYTINYERTSNSPLIQDRTSDVELTGNGITLHHYSDIPIQQNIDASFDIELTENEWIASEGNFASRKLFLVVLQNLDEILVKASQTSDTAVARIKEISLDEGVSYSTDGPRALGVENCTCPLGYTGLSCEECSTGYYRVKGGSFLGTCVPCNCNGHSTMCDKDTGICKDCLHNTMGKYCERCEPGYYGDPLSNGPHACRSCPCPLIEGRSDILVLTTCTMNENANPVCDVCPPGYNGDLCDSCSPGYSGQPPNVPCRLDEVADCDCDPVGSEHGQCDETGQCVCKTSTTGKRCDQCKPGFFYLSVDNLESGCLSCFCMGVTKECTSSTLKRNEITSDFSEDFGGFSLTEQSFHNLISDGFELSNNDRTLSYPRFDLLPKGEGYYWKLPDEYCGDKIVSYGGKLHYKVIYTAHSSGILNKDPDVILIGNDLTIMSHSVGNSFVQPNTVTNRSVTFREENWFKSDGEPATRDHMLIVLADLEAVLLRSTFSSTTLQSSISDVVMETASDSVLMTEPAYEVERCDCPDGYDGTSCEDCAPGFTRLSSGYYLGLCHLCQCNGHADLCDSETGSCFNCRDNTAGQNCELCADGFYGDATRGTEIDCQPCACPGTGENSFSEICRFEVESHSLECTSCQEGYIGRRCENCAPGYVGDPAAPGGKCVRSEDDLLEVNIVPSSVETQDGSEITLQCNVDSPTHFTIEWRRSDAKPLPTNAKIGENGRWIKLFNFSSTQEGRYECIVRSRYQTKNDSAMVTLEREKPMIQVRVEEPRIVLIREGSQVTFVCTATSKMPAYLVMWRKKGGMLPMSRVTDFEGILHINDVQVSDSGTYVCTGSNMYSTDTQSATLRVTRGKDYKMPSVVVSPQNQSVSEGEEAMFYCDAEGFPPPRVEWIKENGIAMPETVHVVGNMLMIPSVSAHDDSLYRCRASNEYGFVEATAALDVVVRGLPPSVQVDSQRVLVTDGENAELRCMSTGSPTPQFTWKKINGENEKYLENMQQFGNILRIISARAENQGDYECKATNFFGYDTGIVHVEVTRNTIAGKPVCRTEPKEVVAYVGTNSTITCVVGGDPLPEVVWETEDGSMLDENIKLVGQDMFINKVHRNNGGNYVCVAISQKGISRSKMTLRVERKDLPTVQISPGRYFRVKVGQNASFTCTTPDQNDTAVTWLRSREKPFTGETYLSDENTRINFKNISLNEAGAYSCLVSNVVGYKQIEVILSVLHPPVIRVTPSHFINVTEGESLFIRCDVFGIPAPSVVWFNSTGPDSPIMLTNYRLRSNSYTIRKVKLIHAGVYDCRAMNHAGNSQQRVTVTVLPKIINRLPVVTIKPPKVQGTIGSEIHIQCSTSGYPEPNITWSKLNDSFPPGTRQINRNLFIANLSAASAGTYQCLARNLIGENIKIVQVVLLELPIIHFRPSVDTFLVSGDSLNISCKTVGGSQPVSLSLTKSHTAENTNEIFNSSHTIIDFNPNLDSGRYTCTGMNIAGSTSLTIKLATLEPPVVSVNFNRSTRLVGQSLLIVCTASSADGLSSLSVRWEKFHNADLETDQSIVIPGRVLNIDEVNLEDSGDYICIATNKAGTSSASFHLNVLEPPTAYISTLENKSYYVEREAANIICNASGSPEVFLKLKKDGFELNLMSNNYLIRSLSLEDAGNYVCFANNEAGRSQAETSIKVYQVPLVSTGSSFVQVRSGETLVLECDAVGFPEPSVIWKKMAATGERFLNESMSTSKQLRINKVDLTDAGKYVCLASNLVGNANTSVKVLIDAFIPYFTQTPLSYMSINIPSYNDFLTGFNITISFRSHTLDGLLLYSHSSNNDFISISLAGGKVEFRFELGSGPVLIRSDSSIELYRWHTITATRLHKNGQLHFDNDPVVIGKSPGEFRGLELTSDLYVGGIPNSVILPPSLRGLGSDSGFYGCISQVNIGSGMLDLGPSDHVNVANGVVRCRTCGPEKDQTPCQNDAICQESHFVETGYVCNCEHGFIGRHCQFKEEELCSKNSCNRHGICTIDLDSMLGFVCSCEYQYSGIRCEIHVAASSVQVPLIVSRVTWPFALGREIGIPTETPSTISSATSSIIMPRDSNNSASNGFNYGFPEAISFKENSYISNSSIQVTQSRRTDVTLRVRRRTHADGLLLYSGESTQDSSFISLAFRSNALELRFNTGTDTTVLQSPRSSIEVDTWHTISIHRRRSRAKLSVDGKVVAQARSSGPELLRLEGPLFIGGVSFWENIPEKVNVRSGFDGCVDDLQIDGVEISLSDAFTKTNTGRCNPLSKTRTNNRKDNLNFQRTSPRYSAKFLASSYASFENNVFQHDENAEQISVRFRTTEPYGLMLYHGEDLVSELQKVSRLRHRRRGARRRKARKQNYITLGVRGSYLVYAFDLGGGRGTATSRFPVSDGVWHTVIIVRRGSLVLMWMDDLSTPVATQSPETHTIANTFGRLYLGSTPDAIFATSGRYTSGFVGCLKDVRLTPISAMRTTELGSSFLNDTSTPALDFSRSGTLERIKLRHCTEP